MRFAAITTTRADTARIINEAIQRTASEVGEAVPLQDGTNAHLGDTVATRRNDPSIRTSTGQPVRNRHTWTVTEINPDGSLTVEDPDRGTARLPTGYVNEHVELGWAVTGYGNQGTTVDVGITVLEPGTSRAQAYVGLTRGRSANHAIVPDAYGDLDPAHVLAGIITQTRSRDSALATRARLHREAGVDIPEVPRHELMELLRRRTAPQRDEPVQQGRC